MKKYSVLALLWLCLMSGSAAQSVDRLMSTVDEKIQACMRRALPEVALRQSISLHVFDDTGLVSEMAANLYWKRFTDQRSKVIIRFTEPPHKDGVALLLEESRDASAEPEMTIYLPELRSTRRISGTAMNGSMFGTGFSYEDFAQFQRIASDHNLRRLDDEELANRANYVVETSPTSATSEYKRIVTFIDQAWCIPVLTQFYGDAEMPMKEIVVAPADVRRLGNRWIPYQLTLRDRVRGGRTEITVDKVELDPDLSDLMFTHSRLSRSR